MQKMFLIFILSSNLFSQSVPAGFKIEKILDLSRLDLAFDILPDGRILVATKDGQVKLYVNNQLREELLIELNDIFFIGESGLTGIAIDLDYPSEPYLYLFYSHIDSTNKVSRFTFKGDLSDSNSSNLVAENELVLLSVPNELSHHNGGTVRFGNDRTLYISTGDDGHPGLVQSLSTYNGKILRINRDGTVPSDNPVFPPFPSRYIKKKPELFAFGLRNPFRFSLNIHDELFIGDVGGQDKEELNISVGGENFGWPHFEGTKVNDSLSTLIKPDPLFPIFEYDHLVGNSSVIALMSYNKLGLNGFPDEFEDTFFYADLFADWIHYLKFDGNKWISREFGMDFFFPVDTKVSIDGSVYILELYSALKKIVYTESPTSINNNEADKKFILNQNYPNPFNPSTSIKYELAERANVNLEVYDISGGHVYTLVNQYQQAGSYSIQWDGNNKFHQTVASGIYFYRIRIGGFTQIRKMLFIK